MSKRNYTHIQELLPTIHAMIAEGMSQREIAEHFGFKDKEVVREALKRERRKMRQIPKTKGRKPAKTLQEYKYENKRLKMENELLRDFLSLTERMRGQNSSIMSSTVTGRNIPSRLCVSFLACPEAATTPM